MKLQELQIKSKEKKSKKVKDTEPPKVKSKKQAKLSTPSTKLTKPTGLSNIKSTRKGERNIRIKQIKHFTQKKRTQNIQPFKHNTQPTLKAEKREAKNRSYINHMKNAPSEEWNADSTYGSRMPPDITGDFSNTRHTQGYKIDDYNLRLRSINERNILSNANAYSFGNNEVDETNLSDTYDDMHETDYKLNASLNRSRVTFRTSPERRPTHTLQRQRLVIDDDEINKLLLNSK